MYRNQTKGIVTINQPHRETEKKIVDANEANINKHNLSTNEENKNNIELIFSFFFFAAENNPKKKLNVTKYNPQQLTIKGKSGV